jgi:drug/metabolite transporter (DMT)-like permease
MKTEPQRPFVRHGFALALVAVAAVWGVTFPVVKESVRRIPPFEFLALRFTLAAVVMTIVSGWRGPGLDREGHRAGILAGAALFAGYAFQTVGLQYTRASNAGFVTGLFVVFAPIFAAAFLRRRPGLAAGAGVVLATVGLALLSLTNHLQVRKGDAIVVFAAISFALQIVALARFAPRHSPAALTAVQMWVAAVGSGIWTLSAEHLRSPDGYAWMGIVVTGLFASAAAFFIQTAAQRHIGPTRTAVILTSEPAFAGLFGFVLLGERLTARGWIGAALILAGMLAAELGPRRRDEGLEPRRSEPVSP